VWYEERSLKAKTCLKVDFSICCQKGKVQLPFLQQPPKLMLELLNGQDPRSQHYLQHIISYNSMFSFTSIGGKVHCSVNDGFGPPQFILHGQNYHRIGSLLPDSGETPKFAQLFTYMILKMKSQIEYLTLGMCYIMLVYFQQIHL